MSEIWKPIEGYEGYYEVSNLGRVRSVDRQIINNNRITNLKGQVLRTHSAAYGYLYVTLTKESVAKHFSVHRLVAKTFIPNPNELPQVNHKDWDTTNNVVENLEWCDAKYNNSHRSNSLNRRYVK
jgi:hypothetical protein